MNSDAGFWLWLLIDVGFVVILAITLVYGIYMWRTRSRKQTRERVRDEATREPTATRMDRSQLLILAT
jgi:hypothetical protein